MRGLLLSLRTELDKNLEFAGHFPSVLLHNDLCSRNLFRAHGNKLKLFDFGFTIIGSPFMEYSFRVIAQNSCDSFYKSCNEKGYNCADVREIISEFAWAAEVARLVLLLDKIERARISEKLVLVPLINGICGIIAMHLRGWTNRN